MPFLAWLQRAAPASEKGLVLSTNNFVNMVGVLAASLVLWLLHDVAGFSPRAIFIIAAALCVAFVLGLQHASHEVRTHTVRLVETLFMRRRLLSLRAPEG